MSRYLLKAITAGLLGALFCRCGFEIAGGGGSQTTNSITVCVVTYGSKPAAGAVVKLVDAKNWAYMTANRICPVLDSTMTDSSGSFTFKSMPETDCNLQVDHREGGVLVRNFSSGSTTVFDTVVLQKYAVLQGSCSGEDGSAESVELEGSAYRTAINQDQTFLISGVSPGHYALLVESNTGAIAIGKSLYLSAGQNIDAG